MDYLTPIDITARRRWIRGDEKMFCDVTHLALILPRAPAREESSGLQHHVSVELGRQGEPRGAEYHVAGAHQQDGRAVPAACVGKCCARLAFGERQPLPMQPGQRAAGDGTR